MKTFIIAEAGVNHNGSAIDGGLLVEAAKQAGADAVKFQVFDPWVLISARYPARQEALRPYVLNDDQIKSVRYSCQNQKIEFMATPFDLKAVNLLEDLEVKRYKIASGDITNSFLLRRVAQTYKPVILSTGMSTLDEVRTAVKLLRGPDITMLHCVSEYPTPPEHMNLRAMRQLDRISGGYSIGLSDHSLSVTLPAVAVAMGATVIEKHLTLSRDQEGPDHKASLEPTEFAEMVHLIREVEAAMGDSEKRPTDAERETMIWARRSLVAARALTAGIKLSECDLVAKRPGIGISPMLCDQIVGRRLNRPLDLDDLISWEHLA